MQTPTNYTLTVASSAKRCLGCQLSKSTPKPDALKPAIPVTAPALPPHITASLRQSISACRAQLKQRTHSAHSETVIDRNAVTQPLHWPPRTDS